MDVRQVDTSQMRALRQPVLLVERLRRGLATEGERSQAELRAERFICVVYLRRGLAVEEIVDPGIKRQPRPRERGVPRQVGRGLAQTLFDVVIQLLANAADLSAVKVLFRRGREHHAALAVDLENPVLVTLWDAGVLSFDVATRGLDCDSHAGRVSPGRFDMITRQRQPGGKELRQSALQESIERYLVPRRVRIECHGGMLLLS